LAIWGRGLYPILVSAESRLPNSSLSLLQSKSKKKEDGESGWSGDQIF
jgi:hypothetical protein